MRDEQLYDLMRSKLVAQVPLRHPSPLGYVMRYQYAQAGRPKEPTLWFYKVADKRYGQRKSTSKWDGTAMLRTESQVVETTMQISATRDFVKGQATASDTLNVVAGVMQSDRWIESLRPDHVQVLRVSNIVTDRTRNDSNQWEESPHFDIVLTHTDTWIDGQPFVNDFTFNVYAI